MKKLIATLALIGALIPLSSAQENKNTGDKATPAKSSETQSPSTIGDGVREAGREIKSAGRKVRRAVITRCADGRHTIKGRAACANHGGVSPRN